MKTIELRIRGYRSLRDVVWRPGDLNVLIGPNGGGKSNLLRVLQLLQAAADGGLAAWVDREGGLVPMLYGAGGESICLDAVVGPVVASTGPVKGKLRYGLTLAGDPANTHGVSRECLLDDAVPAAEGSFLFWQGEDAQFLDREGKRRFLPRGDIRRGEAAISVLGGMLDAGPVIRQTAGYLRSWGVYPEFHTGRDSAPRPTWPGATTRWSKSTGWASESPAGSARGRSICGRPTRPTWPWPCASAKTPAARWATRALSSTSAPC